MKTLVDDAPLKPATPADETAVAPASIEEELSQDAIAELKSVEAEAPASVAQAAEPVVTEPATPLPVENRFKRSNTLRRIGRSLNHIPEDERTREVPALEDFWGIEEVILEAKAREKIGVGSSGRLFWDLTDDQPRQISFDEYEKKLIGLYTRGKTVLESGQSASADNCPAEAPKETFSGQVDKLKTRVDTFENEQSTETLDDLLASAGELGEISGNLRGDAFNESFNAISTLGALTAGLQRIQQQNRAPSKAERHAAPPYFMPGTGDSSRTQVSGTPTPPSEPGCQSRTKSSGSIFRSRNKGIGGERYTSRRISQN